MSTIDVQFMGYSFLFEDVQVSIPEYPRSVVEEYHRSHTFWLHSDRIVAWPMELGIDRFSFDNMLAVSYLSLSAALKWNGKTTKEKACKKITEGIVFNMFDNIVPYFFIKGTENGELFVPITFLPFFVEKSKQAALTYSLYEWIGEQWFSTTNAAAKKSLDYASRLMLFVFPMIFDELPVHLGKISVALTNHKRDVESVRELKRKYEEGLEDIKELKETYKKLIEDHENMKKRLKTIEDRK